LYKFLKKKELETHDASVSKFLALVFGFVCLGLAMLVRNYESLMQACLVVFGIVGGPMFGLFTVGITCPLVNQFVSYGFLSRIGVYVVSSLTHQLLICRVRFADS
jgi:hypothetical protein